jgi:hypothetical protein
MSKRNFILLIIVLIIILLGVVGYWYMLAQKPPTTSEKAPGFLAKFNPFSPSPLPTPLPTATPSSEGGNTTPVPASNQKLIKVSNLSVAGYGVFDKERLIINDSGGDAAPTTGKPLAPKTEFVAALRYVERATGNIFETFATLLSRKFMKLGLVIKAKQ